MATHPNQSRPSAYSPEQSLAILTSARVAEFDDVAEASEDMPDPADLVMSPVWAWRLVGALRHRLTTGDGSRLAGCAEDAPDPAGRAAATVAAASSLLEDARAEEAEALLRACLDPDDANPTDHMWLRLQLARVVLGTGRVEEARALYALVLGAITVPGDDVTASAFRGTAALQIFHLSDDWGSDSLALGIQNSDNAANWWRTQTLAEGATAAIEKNFKTWSRRQEVIFANGDPVTNAFVSASVIASHLGDQVAARRANELLALERLARHNRNDRVDEVGQTLEILRLAGTEDIVARACRRLLVDGPAEALRLTARNIDLNLSTRSTASADLRLLELAGDVLDTETADRTTDWLLDTLDAPGRLIERTKPRFILGVRLLDTLSAVLPAASSGRQERAASAFTVTDVSDQLLSRSLAAVLRALHGAHAVDAVAAGRLLNIAGLDSRLRDTLLGIATSLGDDAALEELLSRVVDGSMFALQQIGDVRTLDGVTVTPLIAQLELRVARMLADVRAGHHSAPMGEAHALALMNVHHPDSARWNVLLEYLGEPLASSSTRAPAIRLLTTSRQLLAGPELLDVLTVARKVAAAERPAHDGMFMSDDDAPNDAWQLVLAIEPSDDPISTIAHLASLLTGGHRQRMQSAYVANQIGVDASFLLPLLVDEHEEVRAEAAISFVRRAVAGETNAMVVSGLAMAADDPGTLVPLQIVRALSNAIHIGLELIAAVSKLCGNRSAATRALALATISRATPPQTRDGSAA